VMLDRYVYGSRGANAEKEGRGKGVLETAYRKETSLLMGEGGERSLFLPTPRPRTNGASLERSSGGGEKKTHKKKKLSGNLKNIYRRQVYYRP